MAYKITEQDFLRLVKKPTCLGTETHKGLAKEGHEKCNNCCKGNYFVGGQCNYGGEHLMGRDVETLNQNFSQFDTLEQKQISLSESKNKQQFEERKARLQDDFKNLEEKCTSDSRSKEFFKYTCIATTPAHSAFLKKIQTQLKLVAKRLERYRKNVEASTWEQLQEFKKKGEQLEKLTQEANQFLEEWKNEDDPDKKRQLMALYVAKMNEVKILAKEIRNDPKFKLFSEEVGNEFGDIMRAIWQGETNFLKLQEEEKKKEEQKKWLGFIPSKYKKKVIWGSVILGVLVMIGLFFYWILKKL